MARWSLGVWAQPCRGLAMSASQGTPGPGYYSMDYANALVCSSLRGCRPQHGPAKTSGRLTAPLTKVPPLPVWELPLHGHTVARRQRLRRSLNCHLVMFDYFGHSSSNFRAFLLRDIGLWAAGGDP